MWCKQRHHETIIWNKQLCVSYKIEHDCFQMNWTSVECVCFVHVKVTSLIMYLSPIHTQRVLFWFWARFSSFSDDLRAPETHIRLNAIDSAVCEYYSIGVAWCQNLARIREILASTMANSVEKCCCLAMACSWLFTALSAWMLSVIFHRQLHVRLFFSVPFVSPLVRSSCSVRTCIVPSLRFTESIFCHCQMQHLIREWTIDTKIIKYNLLQTHREYTRILQRSRISFFVSHFFCTHAVDFAWNHNRFVRNMQNLIFALSSVAFSMIIFVRMRAETHTFKLEVGLRRTI